MSHFVGRVSIYPFKAADTGLWTWALAQPLTWEITDGAGVVTGHIIVPAEFLTDLGSIPPFLRWLFNPADPRCAAAYVLHDWVLHVWGSERQVEAAGLMHQALRSVGEDKWSRLAQIAGVLAAIDNW